MTNQPATPSNNRPAFRLCYSAQTGIGRDGRKELSYPIEIGACFPRKDPSKGLVARFTFLPDQMREGVLFLMPVDASDDTTKELFEGDLDEGAGH